jgi:hypothetical protein
MARRRVLLSAVATLTALLVSAGPGSAATPLGQVAPGDPNGCGDGNYQQSSISSGTSYVVPAGGGVITSWQSRGRMALPGTGRLQVWRLVSGVGYMLVGRSATETFTAGTAPTYSTQIPVAGGDVLGLRINEEQAGCEFSTGDNGDVMLLDPAADPAPGDSLFFFTGILQRRVNVAATLEPDADCDGLGDETQDPSIDPTGCNPPQPQPEPGTADTTPPDTQITDKPKDKTKKKQATFGFNSSEPGSTFNCVLDGREQFKACTSPLTVTVKKGRHTFSVTAVDAAGNADPAPATDDWKVKKRKR